VSLHTAESPTPGGSPRRIRVVLTADNHVDLKYQKYPDPVGKRLREERLAALERVVTGANQRRADLLVVAGDLFDGTDDRVTTKMVKATAEVLATFTGDRVLVLPGNHDYCTGAQSDLWKRFRSETEGSPVLVLDSAEVHQFTIDEQPVQIFACPCNSKTSESNAIGWVREAQKDPTAIRIGIAHGNVEGLGLDQADRYYNMTVEELEAAGLHTWLLGHIHRRAPAEAGTGPRSFFMAGSTTPESVRRNAPGSAWSIEIGATGVVQFEPFQTGAVSFLRIVREFLPTDGPTDIDALEAELSVLEANNTVLDLQLAGELAHDGLQRLDDLLQWVNTRGFIHASIDRAVNERLSAELIGRLHPAGTLAQRLLNDLLTSSEPGDATTALLAIKAMQSDTAKRPTR
jgi:DNA repair exonuclease SbcCD nuclease subunit